MSKRGVNDAFSHGHSKKAKEQQSSLSSFFSYNTSAKGKIDDDDRLSRIASSAKHNDEQDPSLKNEDVHSSSSVKEKSERETMVSSKYKIFCDLDGVLCDFAAGVKKIFNGKGPDEIPINYLWMGIAKSDSFYTNLPWTHDGRELWDTIKHLNPDILTGVPRTNKTRAQKAKWCERELGVKTNHVDMAGKKSSHIRLHGRKQENVVNVITCWSRNKHFESHPNAVLIDDRLSLSYEWEKKGGIFVHHTNTKDTLKKLVELKII